MDVVDVQMLLAAYAAGERTFTGSRLEGADLRGASLAGADLSFVDLAHADLTGADLRGATLDAANLWDVEFTDQFERWWDALTIAEQAAKPVAADRTEDW